MTVNTELARAEFAWTGVETAFAAGFPADKAADVAVFYRTPAGVISTLVAGVNHSVTLATGSKLVTVLPLALPAAPGTVVIRRTTPALVQEILEDGEGFSLQIIQQLHDRAAMRSAEDREEFARALKLPEGGALGVSDFDLGGSGIANARAGTSSSHLATVGQIQDLVIASGNVPAPVLGDVLRFLVATGPDAFAWVAMVLAQIPDGMFTADAAGLAKFADGFLTANAAGRAKMANGFLSADAEGRAKMADAFVAPAKLDRLYLESAGGTLTGGLILSRDPRAALEAVPLRALAGHIDGLILSTDGANAISVSPGLCVADGMLLRLPSGATLALNTDLDAGTEASSTWYHVWAMGNPTTGAVVVKPSLSQINPTMPSGFTAKRRIGAVYNDGSANIRVFEQTGDEFRWSTPPQDVNTASLASANGTLMALSVPTNIKVFAHIQGWFADGVSNQLWLSSPSVPDLGVGPGLGRADGTHTGSAFARTLLTNTSGQIRARGATGTSGQLYISTLGWTDPRGRTV